MAALATRPSVAEQLLVIEDEPRMAMVVTRGLSASGYRMSTASRC
jgi:DNA-binding response OmpR family regulator